MTEITQDTYKYKYEEPALNLLDPKRNRRFAVYDSNPMTFEKPISKITVRFWRLISWYLYFAPIWFFLKI
mgnify:CR=1 FL=1